MPSWGFGLHDNGTFFNDYSLLWRSGIPLSGRGDGVFDSRLSALVRLVFKWSTWGVESKVPMLTSSHQTGEHEELELLVQPQSCYIIEITETWWASSCVLRIVMDGYRLFYKGRQGRRGGWVVLCVKENLGCVTAICGDHGGPLECFWVKLRGVVFEESLTVDICHWPPNQDDRASEAIFRPLKL